MAQLMTLEAEVVMKVMIDVAVTGAVGGALYKCLPPTPNMIMNAIALGIHETISYLCNSSETKTKVYKVAIFTSESLGTRKTLPPSRSD